MRGAGAALVAALIAAILPAPATAAPPALDLERTSATELAAAIEGGELTSLELTRAYLDRIAAVNQRGPSINAVRSLNPDALEEAKESDEIRSASGPRGPLEGLPVLLKDNVDVAGMASTAGSIALEHSVPDRDATIVRKLRAAGAVILGKVNLTEFAAFVSNEQQSGNSSLGGQVLNPFDLSADPGGSSSASGTAAAAGLAALTIGTDSEGSILSPATSNGVVGIRPSTGLWSRAGIVPISFTQDTAGPLTQTVADSALLLTALTGVDPADPMTAGTAAVEGTDYSESLDLGALRGARIGINVANLSNVHYAAARDALDRLGADTVELSLPPFAPSPGFGILVREFRRDLTGYLSQLPPSAPMRTFDEAYAYLKAHPEEGMKYGDSRIRPSSEWNLDDPAQRAAYEAFRDGEVARGRDYLTGLLEQGSGPEDDLDAMLNLQTGLISPAAYAGFPIVSVPAGIVATTGRPINVTFLGRRYDEATLMGFAYAYEQGTQLRRAPSEVNPASWRCVPGPRFAPRSCPPFEPHGSLDEALRAPDLDLERLGIAELRQLLAARRLTPPRLVDAYLERIGFVNRQGPGINAVRAVNPRAKAEAARAIEHEGPLAGIPVLMSDTIDVGGLPTTGGALALEGLVPASDAALVERLRGAGAVVLGKTNVTELSGLMSTGMPAGYGSLSGQVLNPYDVRLSPNGSNAGAAAAVASGLAAGAVGVESDAVTSGTSTVSNGASPSIVVTAAATGVVGMRPTFGLVGRTGVLPVARSQDTPGPLARTVADAAAILTAIAGHDPDDPATASTPASAPDFTAALDEDALAGARIGVIAPGPNDTAARNRFADAVQVITDLGATPVPLTAPARPSTPKIVDRELRRDLEAYLERNDAPVRSLAELIASNDAHPADTLKFGQDRLRAAAAVDLSDPATAAAYQSDLQAGRAAARAWIDGLLASNDVDAIMSPTANTAEVGVRAGYPQITVSAGYDPIRRRPVNVSFTGTAGDDAKLTGFAHAFERAAGVRRTPSEVNPATWHCVAPIAYLPRTCPP
jgi:Asp-tRNA(Asn)/Glu-tRNA(Gln) amidotransferase A subunit family amidase